MVGMVFVAVGSVVVVAVAAATVGVVVARVGEENCLRRRRLPSRPRPLGARACAISRFPGIF